MLACKTPRDPKSLALHFPATHVALLKPTGKNIMIGVTN
jgi:hypothetical protein